MNKPDPNASQAEVDEFYEISAMLLQAEGDFYYNEWDGQC